MKVSKGSSKGMKKIFMSQDGLKNKRKAKESQLFAVYNLHDKIFLHYWFYLNLFENQCFSVLEKKIARFFHKI